MKYSTNPGVIYKTILDEHFLIATGAARGQCPDIRQLNSAAAVYWQLLEQNLETEEMLEVVSVQTGIETDRLRPGLTAFLEELVGQKYIVPEA